MSAEPPEQPDDRLAQEAEDVRLQIAHAHALLYDREKQFREARRQYQRDYYAQHREEQLEYQRQYRAAQRAKDPAAYREGKRARTQRWRDKHREEVNARLREKYRADPEKHRQRRREAYAQNPDEQRARRRAYYGANKEKQLAKRASLSRRCSRRTGRPASMRRFSRSLQRCCAAIPSEELVGGHPVGMPSSRWRSARSRPHPTSGPNGSATA